MRKIFLHFAMTADGMVSNVEQWVSFTEEAMKDASAWHDTVDAIIFGNNNYGPLAGYWQNAETASDSAAERAFARKINDMRKFVLSHGEVELVWKNSELLRRRSHSIQASDYTAQEDARQKYYGGLGRGHLAVISGK